VKLSTLIKDHDPFLNTRSQSMLLSKHADDELEELVSLGNPVMDAHGIAVEPGSIVLLHSSPGIGKTQMCMELARSFIHKHNGRCIVAVIDTEAGWSLDRVTSLLFNPLYYMPLKEEWLDCFEIFSVKHEPKYKQLGAIQAAILQSFGLLAENPKTKAARTVKVADMLELGAGAATRGRADEDDDDYEDVKYKATESMLPHLIIFDSFSGVGNYANGEIDALEEINSYVAKKYRQIRTFFDQMQLVLYPTGSIIAMVDWDTPNIGGVGYVSNKQSGSTSSKFMGGTNVGLKYSEALKVPIDGKDEKVGYIAKVVCEKSRLVRPGIDIPHVVSYSHGAVKMQSALIYLKSVWCPEVREAVLAVGASLFAPSQKAAEKTDTSLKLALSNVLKASQVEHRKAIAAARALNDGTTAGKAAALAKIAEQVEINDEVYFTVRRICIAAARIVEGHIADSPNNMF